MPAGERLPFRDTWFRPLFWTGLCSNCWDQISSNLPVFTRLFILNTPRYFLDFAFYHSHVPLQVDNVSRGYTSGCNYTYMNDEESKHESGWDVAHYKRSLTAMPPGHGSCGRCPSYSPLGFYQVGIYQPLVQERRQVHSNQAVQGECCWCSKR